MKRFLSVVGKRRALFAVGTGVLVVGLIMLVALPRLRLGGRMLRSDSENVSSIARFSRWMVTTAPRLAASLPDELAAAKREGLPLEPADLRPRKPIPDELNAAITYERAIQASRSDKDHPRTSVEAILNGTDLESDVHRFRSYLRRHSADVAAVERATRLPFCDFHYRWEKGIELLFPEFQNMIWWAGLLTARGILQSRDGNLDLAMQSFAEACRIGRHFAQTPAAIGTLKQMDIHDMVSQSWMHVVSRNSTDPDALRLVGTVEAGAFAAPDAVHAFRCELVLTHEWCTTQRGSRPPGWLKDRNGHPDGEAVVNDAYEARTIAYWRRVYDVLRREHGDRMACYWVMKREADRVAANPNPLADMADQEKLARYAEIALTFVYDDACRSLRRGFLMLLQYRLANGSFPASLSDLPAPPPPDPFVPRPINYRRTAKGFVLYSVGSDFRDDGGSPNTDIVVRFP